VLSKRLKADQTTKGPAKQADKGHLSVTAGRVKAQVQTPHQIAASLGWSFTCCSAGLNQALDLRFTMLLLNTFVLLL